MATRSIITSQPSVTCDVCGRNLLRGEQPDVFLSGGQRRIVCELCVARATHEGWRREGGENVGRGREARGRRARTLMGRLLHQREPRVGEDVGEEQSHAVAPPRREYEREDDASARAARRSARARPEVRSRAEARRVTASPVVTEDAARGHESLPVVAADVDLYVARALEIFNASNQPRRVVGVSQSLGTPFAMARTLPGEAALVSIVVGWELCWYRYAVDLQDERAGVRLVAQGTELHELDEADRVANAALDQHGELYLLDGHR